MRAFFWVAVLLLVPVFVTAAPYTVVPTFYGPGATSNGRTAMQGSMKASVSFQGSNTIRTLDDVRTGKSRFITLASADSMNGRWYCLGTVVYTSVATNQTHTLQNVVGYTHDTGCAFNGTCSCSFLPQFCDGRRRIQKMDIPVGNFTGYTDAGAMKFITSNINRASNRWEEIGGLPQPGSQPGPANPCGGTPHESGTPQDARFSAADARNYNPAPSLINNPRSGVSGLMPQPMQNQQSPQSLSATGNGPLSSMQSDIAALAAKVSSSLSGNQEIVPNGPPVGSLIIHPASVAKSAQTNLIWTTLNMSRTAPCRIFIDDKGVAEGNEGTKLIPVESLSIGEHSVRLACKTVKGEAFEKTEKLTVQ